jgi:acyl-CoA thioester hydrolase
MPAPTPVHTNIEVQWRDLDPLGHVNNAVYISYFESARLGYIRSLLPDAQPISPTMPLPASFQIILAEVVCKYRSPARLGERLLAKAWVSGVGHKSFVFEYLLESETEGRIVAEGCSTQVWFDYARNVSCPVPAEMIARMERLQGAPIPRRQ